MGDEDETGNRLPQNAVRVACRKRLRETMLDEKASTLKDRQLFPHEIVQKLRNNHGNQMSTLEKDILSCQWNDICTGVVEAVTTMMMEDDKQQEQKDEGKEGTKANLGKMVPLVDVSGSMSGTSMEVAISLGLLVSEITSPTYRNRCLTFSQTPTWVMLDQSMSLDEKVQKMQHAPWGMNTNFEAAIDKILQVAIKAKLKPEDIPDLIVFSDMQFDQARSSHGRWETHHERIVYQFRRAGIKTCGEEWPVPHIIYWNLRGDTTGFPAQADTPGVTMLSGYSPSLMKLLLAGEPLEEDEEVVMVDEDGRVVTKKAAAKDPFVTIRKALDSEDYDKVRECLYASEEGILKKYTQPAEKEEKGEAGKESSMQIDEDKWVEVEKA